MSDLLVIDLGELSLKSQLQDKLPSLEVSRLSQPVIFLCDTRGLNWGNGTESDQMAP